MAEGTPAHLNGFSFFFLVSHDTLPSNSGLRGLHRLATKPHIHPHPFFFFFVTPATAFALPGGASAASEPRISAAPVTWQTAPRHTNFNFCCDMWRMEVRGGHARCVRLALIRRGDFPPPLLLLLTGYEKRRSPFTRRGARCCQIV